MEVNANSRVYAEELVENGQYLIWSEVDYEGAMKSFNRAIKFNPYSSDAHRGLGDCLVDFKQYKDAMKHYSLAIEYNPNNYWAYIHRGEIYSGYGIDNNQYRQANVKDISKAIEDFTSAIDIDPTESAAYYKRGKCYQELKQYEKAIEDFDEVVEFEPEEWVNYSARGQCYEEWGKMDKAKADLATSERLEAIEKLRGNNSW